MPLSLILPPSQPVEPVTSGQYLSSWMLAQPNLERRYPVGLMWEVPSEVAPQREARQQLLHTLWAGLPHGSSKAEQQRLASFLEELPITGRVPVQQSNPRWLQAHPNKDPILATGERVVLPTQRPTTLTLVLGNGQRYALPHQSGAQAQAYLNACPDPQATQVDHVWIIQPDGHVRRVGVAQWDGDAQEQPAPGAWLWAPARNQEWPEGFSDNLAAFLATQGPSGSASDSSPPLPDAIIKAQPPLRDPVTSTDDFGRIGLLQTPTARMSPTGNMNFSYSHAYPYDRANFFLQPIDWFEFGFRYTNIANRLYGPTIAGGQAYKDKSVDFKAQLLEEGHYQPALALGITDIGGTGLFSSEYLVGNKRWGDFDWSLGIGWGYMANSANIRNPFTFLSPGFAVRQINVGSGGNFNVGSFFHGNSALFGGVQYHTPWDPLILKLEYDGNNYQNEPLGNVLPQRSPINVGLVYRYSPFVDVSAGLERGNTAMLGLTLHDNLAELSMPKVLDPPLPKVTEIAPTVAPNWAKTAQDMNEQTQWVTRAIQQDGTVLHVKLDQIQTSVYFAERIERVTAILNRDAPASIRRFVFTIYQDGLMQTEWVVIRHEWVDRQLHYRAPSQQQAALMSADPANDVEPVDDEPLWQGHPDPLVVGLAPSFTQTVGGPNNFILYQLGVTAAGRLTLSDHTWIDGLANWRVIDNYSLFTYDAPSNLPRVRTDLRQYLTTARLTMPNLQINHTLQITDNQYGLGYAGYLETMFAGVGGEWLYRPWDSHLAFGVNVNRVQQRGFAQDFSLLPYQVTTGHATVYWDTGWHQTHIDLSAGQYLAGDRGVTLDVKRRFTNGVSVGAYATKTNVSAAQFGEGSFDKGIYVQIPFDAMLPSSSPLIGTFLWDPLLRDGGARLARSTTLYDLTSARDQRTREFAPAGSSWWKAMQHLSDNSGPSLWSNIGDSGEWVAQDIFSRDAVEPLLGGAALIGASALLDHRFTTLAANHQTGIWHKLGASANAIPYAVGLSAVGMWWGMGNESEANTAQAALLSGGWAYLIADTSKLITNRSRPYTNQGTYHFGSSFGKGALNSSFPSNTMAVTFAIATPFAQQYNMPWLYVLAGATSFGRIQTQKHFVSDTVAGSLLGYATGSMLTSWKKNKLMPQVSLGADRTVDLNWSY